MDTDKEKEDQELRERIRKDAQDRARAKATGTTAGQGPNGETPPPPVQPQWNTPRRINEFSNVLPDQLIKGLLYRGGKIVIGGIPKSHKTFFLMQMCFCLENGLEFLDWYLEKIPTLYLDLELFEAEIRTRFEEIRKALMCYGPLPHGISAREHASAFKGTPKERKELDHPVNVLMADIRRMLIAFLVIDPSYKFHDADERDTASMRDALEKFEAEMTACSCSLATSAHHVKGDPSKSSAMDMMSGSWFQRSGDVLINLTELEEIDTYALDVRQRSFANVPTFGVRFEYPIFTRDDTLDLGKLRKAGRVAITGDELLDRMLAILASHDQNGGLSSAEWLKHSQVKRNGKMTPVRSWFLKKVTQLKNKKWVYLNNLTNHYQLTATYAQQRAAQQQTSP